MIEMEVALQSVLEDAVDMSSLQGLGQMPKVKIKVFFFSPKKK